MKFYQRYPGDYGKKTARLSLAEHGAYALLMDEIYSTEEALPADIDELCRICRAMSKAEREAVTKVADKFFPIGSDGLRHNERVDEELAKAQPKIEAARENGKKGGRPTGSKNKTQNGTQKKPSGFSEQNPQGTQGESYPDPEPDTLINTESIRRSGSTHASPDDDECPASWEGWRQWFDDEQGLTVDPYSTQDRAKFRPLAQGWVNAGLTFGQMRKAIAKAKTDAKEPIAYMPSYVDRVLATLSAPAAESTESNFERRAREQAEQAAGSFAHFVAAKAPWQSNQSNQTPTEVIDEHSTIPAARRLG